MKIVIFLIKQKFINILKNNGLKYFFIIVNEYYVLNEKLLFKLIKIGTL